MILQLHQEDGAAIYIVVIIIEALLRNLESLGRAGEGPINTYLT